MPRPWHATGTRCRRGARRAKAKDNFGREPGPDFRAIYVRGRINNRVQVFRRDGRFVREYFYVKDTLGNGGVWDLALSVDPAQAYLFNADGENSEVRVLKREDGTVLGAFGRSGRNAGQFHWVHNLAIDSKGDVFTTEVDNGKRVQKFRPAR